MTEPTEIEQVFKNPLLMQRILDRKRIATQYAIPEYVAQTAKFDITQTVAEQLIASLSAEVLSERVVSETQYAKLYVPSGAWQHFKQDHMPAWFVRRWPVKYTTWKAPVHFRQDLHYPDARLALPPEKFGRPIIFEEVAFGDWMEGV